MWPRGKVEQQLAVIDDRLAAIATTLREAKGHSELALVVELEERLDELLRDRHRVAAMIPKQRDGD